MESVSSYLVTFELKSSLYFEPRFLELGAKLRPESRLPMSMLAAFCFPVSLP